MIDEENARQMVGGLFQVAETALVAALKSDRNAAPIVCLNDFNNQLHDAELDQSTLTALVPQGFDAVLAYVVAQLTPRRAEFSCFVLIFDPMDDAAQSTAVVRAEHLLGNTLQCKAPFTRKKMLSGPKLGPVEGMDAAPMLWNDVDRQRYYELGRWAIGLTDQDIADQDLLHDSLLEQAKAQVIASREYIPFAETLSSTGERSISMIQDDSMESSEYVDLLVATQRQNRAELRGVGIASEAYLRNVETNERTAAIIIEVELNSGVVSKTATLWRPAADGTIEFDATSQEPFTPRIWA